MPSTEQLKTKAIAAPSAEKKSQPAKKQKNNPQFHNRPVKEQRRIAKDRRKSYLKKRDHIIQHLNRKDGCLCMYCGKKLLKITVEHIVPLRHGGNNKMDNLGLCCYDCNQAEIGWQFIQLCRQYYNWREITLWRA